MSNNFIHNQLFKTEIPKDIFLDFIKKYGNKYKDYYLFSKASFKKARLEKAIEPFCLLLKKYYYKSKQFYITRFINYRRFITILRQLRKLTIINQPMRSSIHFILMNISYTTKIDNIWDKLCYLMILGNQQIFCYRRITSSQLLLR